MHNENSVFKYVSTVFVSIQLFGFHIFFLCLPSAESCHVLHAVVLVLKASSSWALASDTTIFAFSHPNLGKEFHSETKRTPSQNPFALLILFQGHCRVWDVKAWIQFCLRGAAQKWCSHPASRKDVCNRKTKVSFWADPKVHWGPIHLCLQNSQARLEFNKLVKKRSKWLSFWV